MNKKASIELNFIFNMILTVSSMIFPLVTFPYVSKILLPDGMGKIGFATSVLSYFLMFAQLGIPTYGIRMCSQVRDDKEELSRVVQELLLINVLTSIFVYFVLYLCLKTIPKMIADKYLYIVLSFNIILDTIGIEWLYKGIENYGFITTRSLLFKFFGLVAMFALVKSKNDYIIYAAITILSGYASNILNFINARKYVYLKPVGNYNLRRHIKPIVVFFILTFAATVYVNLDTVMLGMMLTETDVGYYGTAVKIRSILLNIVTALCAVLLPRTSYYVKNGLMDEFNRINGKAMRFTCLLSCSMSVFFILMASQSILFISSPEFMPGVLAMRLIMPTVVIGGISEVTGIQMLVPLGKEKIVLISVICGAITDFIINIMLIPTIGITGAAIGTTVAQLVVIVIQLTYLDKIGISMTKHFYLWKYTIIALLCCVSSYWTIGSISNTFLCLFTSAICYFFTYACLLFVTKDQLFIEIVSIVLGKFVKKVS